MKKIKEKNCSTNFHFALGERKYKLSLLCLIFLATFICGCKKFIEIEAPVTSINSANVYNTDFTAASVLTGIYANMSDGLTTGGLGSMTLFPALSSDELTLYGGTSSSMTSYIPYYTNSLTNTVSIKPYVDIYSTIYTINSAIKGLIESNKLTPSLQQQLVGEAKFMRGFCYFYLVNLYGDVPLVLTTDHKINSIIAKSTKSTVYAQIIADLKDAQTLLSDKYLKGDAMSAYAPGAEERLRPTKWAATALLARAYLYNKNWFDAEREATAVINQSSLYKLTDLESTFLKNSIEAIWQLQPVAKGFNTQDAQLFVLPLSGPSTLPSGKNFYLSKYVTESFEPNDLRAKIWVNSVTVKGITYSYPFKYKVNELNSDVTEYTVVLRLAEQYLIRAEARIQNGDVGNGISDLNLIRNRASDKTPGAAHLPQLSVSLIKDEALKAVLDERQRELFMEWGHRWFDLKRMGFVNEIMSDITKEKGGTWNANWQLYPFGLVDLQNDPGLIQNSGY